METCKALPISQRSLAIDDNGFIPLISVVLRLHDFAIDCTGPALMTGIDRLLFVFTNGTTSQKGEVRFGRSTRLGTLGRTLFRWGGGSIIEVYNRVFAKAISANFCPTLESRQAPLASSVL
jgi:hypothetical protein